MPYRFKEEFRDAIISIPSLRMNITRFNLNEELAQKILKKFPQYAHNIEEYKEVKAEEIQEEEVLIEAEDPITEEIQEEESGTDVMFIEPPQEEKPKEQKKKQSHKPKPGAASKRGV